MNREIARAHMETLLEWAEIYNNEGLEGSRECAMLLLRAARQVARCADIALALPPEPKPSEPPTVDVREG